MKDCYGMSVLSCQHENVVWHYHDSVRMTRTDQRDVWTSPVPMCRLACARKAHVHTHAYAHARKLL